MKNRKLKTFGIILSLIICSSCCFGFFGCGDEIPKTIKASYSSELAAFSFEMAVDKTTVQVGDTVEVSATFTNQSDKDIYIEFPDYICQRLDYDHATLANLISLYIIPVNQNLGVLDIKVEPRYRTVIEKDMQFSYTEKIEVTESGKHKAGADVFFYVGDNLDSNERYTESVNLRIESINIFIKG